MPDQRKRLYDVVKDFSNAFLVTHSGEGLHARPMAVAELREDGELIFATSMDSPKVQEIVEDPTVLVTFQSRLQFVAINGEATMLRDRALIERLWSPSWNVWFPGGKDDPELCLIRVKATDGEYWDMAGLESVKLMVEAVRAAATGRELRQNEELHAKVKM
jgi:general stress protein 26